MNSFLAVSAAIPECQNVSNGTISEEPYLSREQRRQCFELADVALVEIEQELLDPRIRRVIERIQDRVHQLGVASDMQRHTSQGVHNSPVRRSYIWYRLGRRR